MGSEGEHRRYPEASRADKNPERGQTTNLKGTA